MQSAAGGTSQRLNPAVAMMRSRSSRPSAPAGTGQVWPIAVMCAPPKRHGNEERAECIMMNQGHYSYSPIVLTYPRTHRMRLYDRYIQNNSKWPNYIWKIDRSINGRYRFVIGESYGAPGPPGASATKLVHQLCGGAAGFGGQGGGERRRRIPQRHH